MLTPLVQERSTHEISANPSAESMQHETTVVNVLKNNTKSEDTTTVVIRDAQGFIPIF